MDSSKIIHKISVASTKEWWQKRRWQVLVPLNIVDDTWIEIARCCSPDIAASVAECMLRQGADGPTQINIRVIHED
jgi:hypothetical protein